MFQNKSYRHSRQKGKTKKEEDLTIYAKDSLAFTINLGAKLLEISVSSSVFSFGIPIKIRFITLNFVKNILFH